MGRNLSMEEAKEIAGKGPFKTLLQHDDRYSEHRPVVIAFVKNGTKYIHGIICYKNDEGIIEPHYYVSEFDKSKVTVFEGQRWDLIDKYREFTAARCTYDDKREKAKREIEYQESRTMQAKVSEQMKQWDAENQEPKNPFEAGVLERNNP